jgi:chromosome partitioning protein
MRVITFATQKGGTGKSTLATSLGVVAEAAGERACILDLDPQGTSANWYEGRSAETPAVIDRETAGDLEETLGKLRAAGFTLAIIDTPGSDTHATRGAMRAADLILIPVRPSEADLKATMPTLRALQSLGQPFAFVINQAPTQRQTRLTATVSLRLAGEGPVAPVAVGARIDHQYAYALGQGVSEYASDGKAAGEVAELWTWCRKKMETKDAREEERGARSARSRPTPSGRTGARVIAAE